MRWLRVALISGELVAPHLSLCELCCCREPVARISSFCAPAVSLSTGFPDLPVSAVSREHCSRHGHAR